MRSRGETQLQAEERLRPLGERPGPHPFLTAAEGTNPAATSIQTSSFQNCETVNFCCLSHRLCGSVVANEDTGQNATGIARGTENSHLGSHKSYANYA